MPEVWEKVQSTDRDFDAGTAPAGAIGMIALAVDRASISDCRNWLAPFAGVEIYSTRVPMSPVATPESLAAMGDHLAAAAEVLVPGDRLDALAFSCTSGLVAIGAERVHRILSQVRPGVPVVTPIEAAVKGLRGLGVRRLSLLVPYHAEAADLVAGHFAQAGFVIDRCSTFDLDGDIQMNRLDAEALIRGAHAALHPDSDGLFISCTGLRTSGIVARLEAELGVPVVTSNQAMSWECLHHSACPDKMRGEGRLFSLSLQ